MSRDRRPNRGRDSTQRPGGAAREWPAEQLVFISSPMADTAAERQALAAAIEDEGAPIRYPQPNETRKERE